MRLHILLRSWNRLEEALVVFLLTAMTLVTFTYVVVTNLYDVFFDLGDAVPMLETPAFAVGDFLIVAAQQMSWSLALTLAMFGWLIFIGAAYCVRIGAHIGVDLLVRLFPERWQRMLGVLACLLFIFYAALFMVSGYAWLQMLITNNIGVEDLDAFGIKEWHVAIILPISMALIIARLIEVLIRILRGEQLGLEQTNEAADVLAQMERERALEIGAEDPDDRHDDDGHDKPRTRSRAPDSDA